MPRTRRSYPEVFKRQMIDFVRADRSPEELSRAFEPTAQSSRYRVPAGRPGSGRRKDGLTSAERQERVKLRREVRRLREEQDILAKETAWFTRETDSKSNESSSS